MKKLSLILFLSALWAGNAALAVAQGDPKRGAEVYRACAACHALEPDLHLSGPSLAGVFGRTAGTAKGYVRYSRGLKDSGFEWNAATLDGWLKSPQSMIPDTYMLFKGIPDAAARADLIAFLEVAGGPDGGKRAVADGLIAAEVVRGAALEPIRDAPPETRVAEMRHCGDSYFIRTQAGQTIPFWEKNVRLKIDSVETGPPPGIPIMLGAGMGGDRVSVIFSSLAELQTLVKEQC